jgi:hypothetical protein
MPDLKRADNPVSMALTARMAILRHCERSEAIQKCCREDNLDCFVASLLAMTADEGE